MNLKVLASVLFMFFTSIGPAATFSALLQNKTDDQIGFVEVMVSTAITGILWSFFSGQPLVILVSTANDLAHMPILYAHTAGMMPMP